MEAKRTYQSKSVLQAVQEVTKDYYKIFSMDIRKKENDSYKISVEGELYDNSITDISNNLDDSGPNSINRKNKAK